MKPKTAFTAAAASEMPNDTRSAASVRGSVAIRQNSAQPSVDCLEHKRGERDEDDEAEIGQR